jgi:hypothetical protein
MARRGGLICRFVPAAAFVAALLFGLVPQPAGAINIVIDYRYDTNNFFTSNQPAKDALQAAADRYSRIITSTLAAVTLTDDDVDPRVGFTHPATGVLHRLSPAAGAATDDVKTVLGGPTASEYRAWSLAADQWILYAGGRNMSAPGIAGQWDVGNFDNVYDTSDSVVNRNFRAEGGATHLPVWGGSIAFDIMGTNWHFNHTTAVPNGVSAVDFYSVALHEIGHALGLNTAWQEWTSRLIGAQYSGEAVAVYNADNGAAAASLSIENASPTAFNPHWVDNLYGSFIFENESPNLIDTVGAQTLQHLLMDRTLTFGRRFELTNVDVAALRDVGWDTVPQVQLGDFNGDRAVNAADYVLLNKGLANGTYAAWRANFGESLGPSIAAEASNVPEPPALAMLVVAHVAILAASRKRKTLTSVHIPSTDGASPVIRNFNVFAAGGTALMKKPATASQ